MRILFHPITSISTASRSSRWCRSGGRCTILAACPSWRIPSRAPGNRNSSRMSLFPPTLQSMPASPPSWAPRCRFCATRRFPPNMWTWKSLPIQRSADGKEGDCRRYRRSDRDYLSIPLPRIFGPAGFAPGARGARQHHCGQGRIRFLLGKGEGRCAAYRCRLYPSKI